MLKVSWQPSLRRENAADVPAWFGCKLCLEAKCSGHQSLQRLHKLSPGMRCTTVYVRFITRLPLEFHLLQTCRQVLWKWHRIYNALDFVGGGSCGQSVVMYSPSLCLLFPIAGLERFKCHCVEPVPHLSHRVARLYFSCIMDTVLIMADRWY